MTRDAHKRYTSEGSWQYEVTAAGFKYNMSDIQAALGIHQLRRLQSSHARRQELARHYDSAFAELEEVERPTVRPGVEPGWHLYVLRLRLEMLSIDRARFIEELRLRNIMTSVHFIPVHLHPYYRERYGYRPEDFPVAWREYQRIVSLPLYPRMSDADAEDVVEAVTAVVQRYRR
jgi:dTDP-4-amino-4,6-dideoxygalactose transaminase